MGLACFYLMANHKRGTIYAGATRDMLARDHEHKTKADPDSFTARYDCTRLVHVEFFESLRDAVARENAVKRWKRQWKIELIEKNNPGWVNITLDPRDLERNGFLP